ncbi:hypothetical protein HDV64DRAFT_24759 [Trichoderma sp. TUCIM 5745]
MVLYLRLLDPKVETGVHSPPAPGRIGQQLGRIAHLIGSWTAMAECTDVETIRAGPANRRCAQRYRDNARGKICAETRLCLFVIVFSPLVFLFFFSRVSSSHLGYFFSSSSLPLMGLPCLVLGHLTYHHILYFMQSVYSSSRMT